MANRSRCRPNNWWFFIISNWSNQSILIIILFLTIGVFSILKLPAKPSDSYQPFSFGHSIEQMKEGLSFVFSNRTLLWAISLDLFAVLFGGCVALLPIFATDILHVSSQGYGWLRAASSMGSVLSLLILARRPLHKNTGNGSCFLSPCLVFVRSALLFQNFYSILDFTFSNGSI